MAARENGRHPARRFRRDSSIRRYSLLERNRLDRNSCVRRHSTFLKASKRTCSGTQ